MGKSRRTQEQIIQDDYSDYLNRWYHIHSNDNKDKPKPKPKPKQVKRKRTESEVLADGFDRLLNIGTNLYKNKPMNNNIFNLSTNLYNSKPTKNNIFDLSTNLYTLPTSMQKLALELITLTILRFQKLQENLKTMKPKIL